MTDAEKALAKFENAKSKTTLNGNMQVYYISIENEAAIRKALQGVDENKEAFELTKRLWLKQTDENIEIKDKVQGLLKALDVIVYKQSLTDNEKLHDIKILVNAFNSDETAITSGIEYGVKAAAKECAKAIHEKIEDETGMGL